MTNQSRRPLLAILAKLSLAAGICFHGMAQIDPRSVTPIVLAASGPIGANDDGWGVCPRFTHFHTSVKLMDRAIHACLSHPPDYKHCHVVEWEASIRQDGIRENGVLLDGKCHMNSPDDSPVNVKPLLPESGRRYF